MTKCPYCGWECVEIVGRPYSGLGRGRCPNCQSNGPEVSPPEAAIFAFCHPAHLHAYNPATHIVVSREAAENLLRFSDTPWPYLETDPEYKKLQAAIDKLRAALEVGE